MNKVYTIGRDTSCDIVIPDSTDVVSRVHASLKVKGHGKYILIDQSRNGTYVNGIKMSANEEIPVTRKDIISLAHVRDLDWSQIPKEKTSRMMWLLAAITVTIIVAFLCYILFKPQISPVQPVDEFIVPEVIEDLPTVRDTAAKETIYIRPNPEAKPNPKKRKEKEQPEEQPPKEEPEVVNPLL